MNALPNPDPVAPPIFSGAVVGLIGWLGLLAGAICIIGIAIYGVNYRRGTFGKMTSRLLWIIIVSGAFAILFGSGWSLLQP